MKKALEIFVILLGLSVIVGIAYLKTL